MTTELPDVDDVSWDDDSTPYEVVLTDDLVARLLDRHRQAELELADMSDDDKRAIVEQQRIDPAHIFVRNRPVRKPRVTDWIHRITNGEWQGREMIDVASMSTSRGYWTGDRTIGKGLIIDGFHRLSAFAEVDMEDIRQRYGDDYLLVRIVACADPLIMAVSNRGAKHLSADTVAQFGAPYPKETTLTVRAIDGLRRGIDKFHARPGRDPNRITDMGMLEFIDENFSKSYLQEIGDFINNLRAPYRGAKQAMIPKKFASWLLHILADRAWSTDPNAVTPDPDVNGLDPVQRFLTYLHITPADFHNSYQENQENHEMANANVVRLLIEEMAVQRRNAPGDSERSRLDFVAMLVAYNASLDQKILTQRQLKIMMKKPLTKPFTPGIEEKVRLSMTEWLNEGRVFEYPNQTIE